MADEREAMPKEREREYLDFIGMRTGQIVSLFMQEMNDLYPESKNPEAASDHLMALAHTCMLAMKATCGDTEMALRMAAAIKHAMEAVAGKDYNIDIKHDELLH